MLPGKSYGQTASKMKNTVYTVQVVEDAAMELAVENADMVGKSN